MTTPNGQHHLDPNGSTKQATSTVLALDGWGPVIAEATSNGANGNEAEAIAQPAPQLEAHEPQAEPRGRTFADWQGWFTRLEVDPQVVRILAPALAMALAIFAGLQLGSLYQWPTAPVHAPSPPSRAEVIRRRVALAIDPSLTPVEPEPRRLLDWIR